MSKRRQNALVLPVLCVLVGLAAHAEPSDPTPVPPATTPAPLVTICHVSENGQPVEPRTLRVASEAVPAHLKHGDRLGACPS